MVYYEIIVDAPLHVDFKYKETVNGVSAREEARKKWKAKGYRVRRIKTRYAEPPKIIRIGKKK